MPPAIARAPISMSDDARDWASGGASGGANGGASSGMSCGMSNWLNASVKQNANRTQKKRINLMTEPVLLDLMIGIDILQIVIYTNASKFKFSRADGIPPAQHNANMINDYSQTAGADGNPPAQH